MHFTPRFLVVVSALFIVSPSANAEQSKLLCYGNLETSQREIKHAGISYWLWYEISGEKANVRIAGREFSATSEQGSTFPGVWIKSIGKEHHFSFLPSDGGTTRAELEDNVWFSGNCLPPSA